VQRLHRSPTGTTTGTREPVAEKAAAAVTHVLDGEQFRERATAVEPATSSLGSCSRKGRKTMILGRNRNGLKILRSLAVSTGFTQFH
jgi:hypothetical protein